MIRKFVRMFIEGMEMLFIALGTGLLILLFWPLLLWDFLKEWSAKKEYRVRDVAREGFVRWSK